MSYADRRQALRKMMQPGEYIMLSTGNGAFFLCPLLDISTMGMMLYAPGFCGTDDQVEDGVIVDECPEKLRALLKDKRGDIVWSGGDVCGIRFRQGLNVSNAELHDLTAAEYA